MKRKTLADVAAVAGVSVKTVSHVLSGNPNVRLPESTRERVRAAALQVGYRANRFAQAMQSGRTDLISVWLPLERLIPVYQEFLYEISLCAKETDHGILVAGVESQLAYGGMGESPKVWPVDGMVVIDAEKSILAFREDPRNDHIPISVLGFEQFENADSVGWEVAAASRSITQLCINAGAKRIVHITPDWIMANFPREQRRRGYNEAMTEAGLETDFIAVPGQASSDARSALIQYLASNPCPDAITSFNDRFAIGVIQALEESGVNVPGDCLVWGFGDMPEGRDWKIPISTLKIPTRQIVRKSWEWLLERIKDHSIDSRLASIPMDIISRESTGNLPIKF